MCLAIHKPAGAAIKKKYLEQGFRANPDGAGYCYAAAGSLVICKGFMTWPAFWDSWDRINSRWPALIHFRLATHGPKDAANCHPFALLNGRAAMIHNGIIPGIAAAGPAASQSDTAVFAATILDPLLAHNPADSAHVRYVVEGAIGQSNKVAILYESGKVVIYNASGGHRHKGCWYSNTSYRPAPIYVTTTTPRAGFGAWPARRATWLDDDYAVDRDTPPAPAGRKNGNVTWHYCRSCYRSYSSTDTYGDFCPLCYTSVGGSGGSV